MISENTSLKDLNTFGINVVAKHFAKFQSIGDLQSICESSFFHSAYRNNQAIILGGGSNILFTQNVNGLVLKNEITGIENVAEDSEHVYVKAGAGENWHGFVLHCLKNNYAGVENLALIPGNVGASPMQNIGAYGVEVKDVFHSLEAFDIEQNKMIIFDTQDCKFGYRDSIFKTAYKGKFIILSVTFRLAKTPVFNTSYGALQTELGNMNLPGLSIQAIAQAVINIRQSKLPDPKQIGNAGSFFKNPEVAVEKFEQIKSEFPNIVGHPSGTNKVKLAAGWMIEQCGWKGYRSGDAGCHARQALVLVNYGNASGKEILDLSSGIIESVHAKFDVLLEREVNVF